MKKMQHKLSQRSSISAKRAYRNGAEAEYECECIECGYQMNSEKHCRDIKCPECGGQMRRIERPGPGRKEQRRDLVSRTYQLRADTLDEKTRSVEAVIATEAMVQVFDWNQLRVVNEILLMSGCRIPANAQVPMQDTHDISTVQKQLGSTRELHIEGNKLIGRNYFSNSKDAEHAWTLTREGHLKDNSIGYRVINPVIIEAGQTAEVEGQSFTAPANQDLRIVTEWELKGNSICQIGADVTAKNRNEVVNVNRKDNKMEKFKVWLEKRGLDYETLDEQQRTALQADFDADQKRQKAEDDKQKAEDSKRSAANVPANESGKTADTDTQRTQTAQPDPQKIADDAVSKERLRVNSIRALAGDDVPDELIERCISEGTGLDEVRSQVLEAVRKARPKVGSPAIHMADGNMNRDLLADAILLRAGFDDVILADKDQGAKRAEMADKVRDINLLDVCRQAIVLEGQTIPVGREDTIRAAFSTSSLAIILGAIVNKSLLKGYDDVPQTWRKWCNIGSAPDFKTITRARLTDTGSLEEVGSGGEVGYGGAEEEYEQYNISTYAKNFAVTRQQIINDDLGALTRQPRNMGIRANQKVADLVYTSLLANSNMQDGVALFHADHSNLNTGATLAAATLRAAVTAFYKQTDKDGKPIGVAPKYLVVPPDLMLLAMELVKSAAIIIAGTAGSVTERGARNVLADLMLEVASDPRMSNSTYTGYSTTTWYLTADPKVTDTLEVAFLNGKQTPTLERFNPGPDRMGLVSRVYHDAGVKPLDHRTMAKNTA